MNENWKGKIYLFDMDGTLVNSMPKATQVVLSFLDERSIAYPDDFIKRISPLGYLGIAEYYAKNMGVSMSAEEIFACFTRRLTKAYAEEMPLKEGAKEALLALKARGECVCMLSGSPLSFMVPCLEHTGVLDLFERVWSTDDFGLTKSDVKIFEEVAERLGVSVRDLVMIDDSINVLRTAKKAGATAVGVYDEYSADVEEEMSQVADRYVYTLRELV